MLCLATLPFYSKDLENKRGMRALVLADDVFNDEFVLGAYL